MSYAIELLKRELEYKKNDYDFCPNEKIKAEIADLEEAIIKLS